MELTCDVLIVGGGVGGVAAALAASDLGRQVVLAEPGSRVGGQLTSQAVPPDEHPWVETTGTTARYRQLREAVRTRYKQTRRLTQKAQRDPLFNPGAAWVSNLSAEPEVFLEVLEELLRRLPRRREYREPELNRFIEVVHPDYCTIRREWIMGRYMERKDGIYKLAERGRTAIGA